MHSKPTDSIAPTATDEPLEHDPDEPERPIETAHHRLILLPGMEPMLRMIMRDVERAQTRIHVETYIYRGDRFGRAFADAMARAAARGVDVRLLYDPLGSQETDAAFFEELRGRGVVVRAYRPMSVMLRSASYGPRDHSRVVVIDDAAYTGGAAWGDEWLPRHRGGKGWHDVCVRAQGPCVRDFAAVFALRWREAVGEGAGPTDYTTADRYADLELVADAPYGRSLVYDHYRRAVRAATGRVWIEQAYFFPPPGLLRDLYDAAARGVDVRVILPAESDLPLIDRAARSEYRAWLRHGVRLFEYGPCMVHSKFALVDESWCTVGTCNVSPPSLGWANEVNVMVFDRAFVQRTARLFRADLARSCEITEATLPRRGLGQQVVDRLANDLLALLDAAREGSH